jgi:hypothetical protein
MKDHRLVVVIVTTCLFVTLLLLGPLLWSRWIGELPGAQ